jgi:hypothetical protein
MSRAYISFFTFLLLFGKPLISAHSHRQEMIAADEILRSAPPVGERDVA